MLKLFFEFYKHFSTLSATVAILMVALYGALDLSSRSAIWGMVLMGTTLLLSLVGLLMMLFMAEDWWDGGPGLFSVLLAIAAVSTFLTGLLFFGAVAAGRTPEVPMPF